MRVLSILTLAMMLALPAQAAMYGKFMVVKRDVKVRKKDGKESAAKVGASVYPGDTIVSGKDSRAKIVMSDRNVIHISPDTVLKIKKYTNKGKIKNVELQLDQGKVRNNVENKYDGEKSKFIIKTPTAVAGVRGTQFITSFAKRTRVTEVVTLKGAVTFKSLKGNAKPVVVNKGFRSSAGEGQVAKPPQKVPKSALRSIDRETSGRKPPKEQRPGAKKQQPSKEGGDGSAAGGSTNGAKPKTDTVKRPEIDKPPAPDAAVGGAFKPPQVRRPPAKVRNLPGDVQRNKNNKTRVKITPNPGSATGS